MKGTKRLAAAITTLFAAGALALSASAAAAHNYKGDINRDDKVNITDLVCLNKHFQGVSYIPEENIVYADMDGNGKLNVIDFMFLKMAALSDDEPEEIEITAPAETTPAVTTKTTAAATTAVTTKTTAATTKVTTAATTKAATTSTTKAAAVTTTTTASSTNKTSSATTTTTTTSTTTASSAATTTTTTTTTKATSATTTTTTATTAASEASTSKTYPAKIGNGVNDLADASKDRAWIVLGGSAEECDYVANASDFVPGSVKMPEITGDGTYTASFYVYDEALVPHGGSITFARLKLLKAGTWETYSLSEKPDLKLTVTGATIDGQKVSDEKISALTQSSDSATVQIDSILGPVNSVEIEFTVEGFNDTNKVKLNSSAIEAKGNSNLEYDLSTVLQSGDVVEDIVINFSADNDENIGHINFNLHADNWNNNILNLNVDKMISGSSKSYSLATEDNADLSKLTSSNVLHMMNYSYSNSTLKINSIEIILKS